MATQVKDSPRPRRSGATARLKPCCRASTIEYNTRPAAPKFAEKWGAAKKKAIILFQARFASVSFCAIFWARSLERSPGPCKCRRNTWCRALALHPKIGRGRVVAKARLQKSTTAAHSEHVRGPRLEKQNQSGEARLLRYLVWIWAPSRSATVALANLGEAMLP
ncbi:hypothetical protein NL676_006734 [Syzygium grande]|nr:hypothetical protein NL676_006734 [Syzygium grande]